MCIQPAASGLASYCSRLSFVSCYYAALPSWQSSRFLLRPLPPPFESRPFFFPFWQNSMRFRARRVIKSEENFRYERFSISPLLFWYVSCVVVRILRGVELTVGSEAVVREGDMVFRGALRFCEMRWGMSACMHACQGFVCVRACVQVAPPFLYNVQCGACTREGVKAHLNPGWEAM